MSNTGRSSVSIKAIGDLLSEFNGTDRDFGEWERQVKLLCYTYELDDNMTKILIGSKLRGKAVQWFHSKSEYELNSKDLLVKIKFMFDC